MQTEAERPAERGRQLDPLHCHYREVLSVDKNRHIFASTTREWVVASNVVEAALRLYARAVKNKTLDLDRHAKFYLVPHSIQTNYRVEGYRPKAVQASYIGYASLDTRYSE